MKTTLLLLLMAPLLLATSLSALANNSVHAKAGPDVTLGVWQGSIGSARIMACFVPSATHDSSYYYLRHRTSIQLTHAGDRGYKWLEGDTVEPRATWILIPDKNGHLTGTWSDNINKNAKTLPVDLTRIAPTTSQVGDECGTEGSVAYKSFNGPRVAHENFHVQSFDNKTLVSVMNDSISIVLPPNTLDASAVGNEAKSWLDSKIAEAYSCQFNFNSMKSKEHAAPYFRYRLYIRSRSPHWLVGTQLGSKYCGEDSQIQSDQDAFVWNLDKSKEVNPWTWISNDKSGCPKTCHNKLPSALQDIIVNLTQSNPENSECAQLIRKNDTYFIWPTSRGLVFSGIVYDSRDCDYETEVPYDSMQAFLTKAGKLATKSFQEEQAPDLHTFGK